MDNKMIPKLIENIQKSETELIIPCLQILGNISTWTNYIGLLL
jgi:hypothetical protein